MSETTLAALLPGETARIERLITAGEMRRRLLDIGLTPGASVTALRRGGGGSITAYDVRGAVIALRRTDAQTVLVRRTEEGGVTRP